MMNPILQMISNSNNVSNVMGMLKGVQNPEAMYSQLLNSNPQFKQFVEANKGKTPEQIAQENGIDFNLIKSFLYK